RDQFVTTHDGFATAQINDHIAVFDALHSTVDDFADTVLVFVILAVTLGFAHFLHDDLLCRLRGDTAEIHRRKLVSDEITNLCVRVAITGGEERNLRRVILDVFNDFEQALQLDLTGLRIDVRANVAFLAVTRTRRLLDRIGHGRKNDLAVDRLLACDRIGDLQKLQPVSTDCHWTLLGVASGSSRCRTPETYSLSSASSDAAPSDCPSASSLPRSSPGMRPSRRALSLRSASRIRSSVRTRRASEIRSNGMRTTGSLP